MLQNSVGTTKPPLYRGFPLPIYELSPDSFEDFVYQALTQLSYSKGFEMQSGRQPSGDQGFDCTAKIKGKRELVCIQCKRYSKALNTSTVAEEIIKVALESILNNSTVKQHYIITSGTVSSSLRQILRQNSHLNLKKECENIIIKQKSQHVLLKKIAEEKIDPLKVINKYIDSLDKLLVWSGIDFQNELLVIWKSLDNILEQHFLIERILKDEPTPDFDVNSYLNKKTQSEKKFAHLYYNPSSLPVNLISECQLEKYDRDVFSVDEIICLLKNNKNIVLSSAGGSGKSYTLTIIEHVLAITQCDIEYVPVRVNLRHYSRNTLNTTITQELGINYGSWKSLPFKFILLFDGLDEMLQHDTQSFYDDLSSILENNNYILTVRNTGLSVGTTSKLINTCFSIQPLSYRGVFSIASKIFSGDALKKFYNEYREKINIAEYNFLSSPFVLSMSIDYYKQHNALPINIEDVLEDWVSRKIKGDQCRVNSISLKINKLPISKIVDAFSLILYKASFENDISSISENAFIELIMDCYDELSDLKEYLPRVLTLDEFISMAHHYEILYKGEDNFFSTPHSIISDYLSSKVLARNWRKYKELNFNIKNHDAWIYCSNFLDDEDKIEYLNTVFDFDICLGAKVAIKFEGDFVTYIQDKVLELEKSEKVLTRSNAIYALGILGTEKCYKRLKSLEGYIDHHHPYQRRRALALNGDKDTLSEILGENEDKAQAPIKISGGDYSLWFTSPPTIITDIARGRIREWLDNQRPPLCMSLRTLALFGDSFDIDNLLFVLKKTDYEQEFFDAAKALLEIDQHSLIKGLDSIINNKTASSHWAKKILFSMGRECNVDDEFDYFIAQSKKDEKELSNQGYVYRLDKLVSFLKNTNLDDAKTKILVDTYKNLKFSSGFFYRSLMWSLARKGKAGCFLPIVKIAYSKNDPDEINNAINYLCHLDEIAIDDELSKKINEYFDSLDDEYIGIFHYYIQYYYKHKDKNFAMDLMREKITKILSNLSPKDITRERYFYSIFDYNIIFDFLSEDANDEFNINKDDSLRFLLINTQFLSDKENRVKLKMLSKIDNQTLDSYCDEILDGDVKIHAINYLLVNDLSAKPKLFLEVYLSDFFSQHVFHPTIEHVCLRSWNDDLAKFFLTNFVGCNWDPVSAQLFEKYTNSFCKLLTYDQLKDFEENRTSSVNYCVKRIYQIWLESKNLVLS